MSTYYIADACIVSNPCKNNGNCIATDKPDEFKCQCQTRPKKMKVRKKHCAENVAFRKIALQSTRYNQYFAGRAVDGDVNTGSSTMQEKSPHWLKVDFEGMKVIDEIEMRIRLRSTTNPFHIVMSNTTNFQESKHCYTIPNRVGHDYSKNVQFKCVDGTTAAQFMKVEFINFKALAIQEITVFGWDV